MKQVYSRVNSKLLLCNVIHSSDITTNRQELFPPDASVQINARLAHSDTHVPAHIHLPNFRTTHRTQEAWIIITGSVNAEIYDIDHTAILTVRLETGDCIAFVNGGHELIGLSDDTKMYEIKTGPFDINKIDKQLI